MSKELFEGFNGRIICRECAGITAKASGMKRDLHGAKIFKITEDEKKEWLEVMGEPMKCGCC